MQTLITSNGPNRNVFIFHGTGGYPEENWFPWLKEQLEKKRCRVFIPQFPPSKNEMLESWLSVLYPYQKYFDKHTILIGHSRGGIFALRLLERLSSPISATFLVAASIGIKPYVLYNESLTFAHGYVFDWQNIRLKSKHFFIYHSDNDPNTCLENGEEIAEKLTVPLTLIPHAGHFNTNSGFTKFNRLLQDLESVL
jgi:predicted alpha/beta hydrolase family esterase